MDEIDAALGEDDSRGAVQSLVARQRLGNLDYDEVSALFRNPTLRRSLREVLREFPEAEAVVREEVPFVWHMLSQGRGRDLGFEIGL